MFDIVHRIGVRAPASDVYDAVSTVEGIAQWWSRATAPTAPDGDAVETRFHRQDGREIGHMRYAIHVREPGREIHWRFTDGPAEWIGTDATFALTPAGDMTILVFGHRKWREPVEFMAHCSMKWAVFLVSLRDQVETGTGRPAPDDVKIDDWN